MWAVACYAFAMKWALNRTALRSALILGLMALLMDAAPTFAQKESVAILGIRSLEGDDEMASDLTSSLRRAGRNVSEWRVLPTKVALAQMLLVSGCETPDAPCLKEIAANLSADQVVFGTLQREEQEGFFTLALARYSRAENAIEARISQTVDRSKMTPAQLSKLSKSLIRKMSQASSLGDVLLTAEPGSSVSIDGDYVGDVGSDGQLMVRQLEEGEHTMNIKQPDGTTSEGTFMVMGGATTDVSESEFALSGGAETSETNSSGSLDWRMPTGIGLAAVGLVGIVLGIYSSTRVLDYRNQEEEARAAAASGMMLSSPTFFQQLLFNVPADA